jgi:large subunit ribosomal protein L5
VAPDVGFSGSFVNISLARQRDFRGMSPDSFDGRGNYTLGLREQLVWPEINTTKLIKCAVWKSALSPRLH